MPEIEDEDRKIFVVDDTGVVLVQCISVADRSQGLDHQGVYAEEELNPINKVLARGQGLVGFISEFWTILRRN